jgi:flagellar biosynthesis protein FlhB
VPSEDRSERATPRRKQKAREKGQIARSRDLSAAFSLAAVVFLFSFFAASYPSEWRSFLSISLDAATKSDFSNPNQLFFAAEVIVMRWVAPLMAVGWVFAIAATIAQGGVVFSAEAFSPNWAHLNPANNLKNIFSVAGLSRFLKTLFPFAVILYLVFGMFEHHWGKISNASALSVHATLDLSAKLIFEVAWKASLVMVLWSGIDYLLQRLNFERSLRMSKEEVKDEMKDTEGNPQVRSRIRRLRRDMRRRWKLKDVKRAAVVVTNPEHFAVALEYQPATMRAPIMIAKGRNLLAQKIKQFAQWHEIPIVENRPLAQALYKAVDVGESIPANLYAAVAEVLAFIFRAQARASAAAAGRTASTNGATAPLASLTRR